MEKILQIIKRFIPTKIFKTFQPGYHFFLSWFSAAVYGYPSEELIVIGITGTTGKTTSVYMIAKALESAGYKTGFTSTAIFNDGRNEWLNDKKMTMVGRFFTQKILRQMVKNGCRCAIIETTSEGVRQFRHRFINYDILVFTGLYPEHIESHGSFENYKKAKGKLFEHLRMCRKKYIDGNLAVEAVKNGLRKIELKAVKKTVVVNLDDDHASYFLSFGADRKIGYTKKAEAFSDGSIEVLPYGDIVSDLGGTGFAAAGQKIKLRLLGAFNVQNAMNAIGVGTALGGRPEDVKKGLESVGGIAGRLEKIDEGQPFTVIVDYAYEPKALSKIYETVAVIPHDSIIHVLGSTGGGRDAARRPRLGELAGRGASTVIVTNEDPYDEDPEIIIKQVALGAERAGKKAGFNLFLITDRREAIKKAFSLAKEKDIVLITGKGSEQAICVANGKKIKWDDRIVARELLSEIS
ncbi:hypothetical protein A2303_02420 [Candidatus Falkowbacteria bacterium RIFOXYB2_FULL_47_14]|uniref:UDP-N-acetylmuramyl-tripeptide synthetase n=1 Tax=Candidatus Falkowbacteria bacterium RIFOXYA2_FULL_47_19 TaxID=1797994 RepID=A0A1F5SF20_9BACT|nr:MAG: hypothetical protein A2227_07600 [Candidatus Falkowbacteria bacterium RIFOXYA2_FULL_47_19]OGF35274.1 MAG: hypothetical protein A2468_01230 [Candidatus Falkowbacteria bacterium RIFOXYC2_FULL_46_15]OGF43916.1 MAG: hypothetical protein A2303_02420 [Candidatus Falkowbacteria bacterium RIFOXYB2_FULL_47_14]